MFSACSLLVFAFVTSLSVFVTLTKSYVMPVFTKTGVVSTDINSDDLNLIDRGASSFFGCVEDLMNVMKVWLYNNIFGIELKQESEESQSFFQSLMVYIGFYDKPEQSGFPNSSNLSILVLIFALYFGYLFMATKCFNLPKPIDRSIFMRKFVNYWNTNEENDFTATHEQIEEEDNPDLDSFGYSSCSICCNQRQKLSLESQTDLTRLVQPVEIVNFPSCDICDPGR
nr:uncharacterized protein LOC111424586 isoform X1 [Onthophagus taurus]